MLFPVIETFKDKTKTRVDFRTNEFTKLLLQRGLNLSWSQAAECPCHTKSTNYGLDLQNVTDINATPDEYNTACPICKGNGLILHSPQNIRGIITSAKGDIEITKHGQAQIETVEISLRPEHLPSFGDQFKLVDSVIIWRESQVKTNTNTQALSRKIVSRTLDLATGEKTVGVVYLHIADANGLAVVGGELIEGIHFGITNGDIDWTKGTTPTPPATGRRFSIAYYTHPIYQVIEHPHTIRDTILMNRSTAQVETPTAMLVQAKAKLLTV